MIDSNQVPFDEKRLLKLLAQYWGYGEFRTQQVGPIKAFAGGSDTLAVMPTGGGKSLCYQITGLYNGGICLIVSPLVALMRDQVEDLKTRGLRAISLAGKLTSNDIERLLDNAERMPNCFLYCSPERLKHPLLLARIKRLAIRTIVLDEAHCISQWGHDFRPEYRDVAKLRDVCPQAVWGAFTATATESVIADIQIQLGLRNTALFTFPMQRDNLIYSVLQTGDADAELLSALKASNGCGLVYVTSRSSAESWSNRMKESGVSAAAYHAGMSSVERALVQEAWMKGERRVLACTSAFGMGVDKQDVRFVFHAGPPHDLESYVQEAGRAGRDGKPSACVLFINKEALTLGEKRVTEKAPRMDSIQRIYQGLANQGVVPIGSKPEIETIFNLETWLEANQMNSLEWKSGMDFLQRSGYIKSRRDRREEHFKVIVLNPGSSVLKQKSPASFAFLSVLQELFNSKNSNDEGISIRSLSVESGLSAHQCKAELFRLSNWGFIEYRLVSSCYQISWLRPREEAKHVVIPNTLGVDWVRGLHEKWRSLVDYVESDVCRQSTIQNYFQLLEVKPCGSCDNCKKNDRDWAKQKWLIPIPSQGEQIDLLFKRVPIRYKSVLLHFMHEWAESGEIEITNRTLFRH